MLLVTSGVRVTVANVPPFIKEEDLVKDVVSHRRQLLVVLSNRGEELNLKVKIKVEAFDYPVYISCGNRTCFVCG